MTFESALEGPVALAVDRKGLDTDSMPRQHQYDLNRDEVTDSITWKRWSLSCLSAVKSGIKGTVMRQQQQQSVPILLYFNDSNSTGSTDTLPRWCAITDSPVGLKATTRHQLEVDSNARVRAWQQQLGVNTSLVETGRCLVLHQRLAPKRRLVLTVDDSSSLGMAA